MFCLLWCARHPVLARGHTITAENFFPANTPIPADRYGDVP
jgi:hypothetical protein